MLRTSCCRDGFVYRRPCAQGASDAVRTLSERFVMHSHHRLLTIASIGESAPVSASVAKPRARSRAEAPPPRQASPVCARCGGRMMTQTQGRNEFSVGGRLPKQTLSDRVRKLQDGIAVSAVGRPTTLSFQKIALVDYCLDQELLRPRTQIRYHQRRAIGQLVGRLQTPPRVAHQDDHSGQATTRRPRGRI